MNAERNVSEEITRVIFRMDDGDPVAVFPKDEPGPNNLGCYAHIGQHSQASREWYRTTKPATPEQYADLKRELEAAPYHYRFKVMKRLQPWRTA